MSAATLTAPFRWARDAVYISAGFGLLAVQRANVRRVEIQRALVDAGVVDREVTRLVDDVVARTPEVMTMPLRAAAREVGRLTAGLRDHRD